MKSFDDLSEDGSYLPLLLQMIEHQLQWGAVKLWRHRDFELLSEKILDETGEQLSATTLKRIWGKLSYRSLPASYTLNTLARFAGFESWLVFIAGLQDRPQQSASARAGQMEPVPARPGGAVLKKYALPALFFCLAALLLSLVLLNPPGNQPPVKPAEVSFSSYPVSTGVPNTVVFKYDVSKVTADSFHLQQSWDSTLRSPIRKDQFEVARTYYYPGYWRAKLFADGQVLKEHDVYIRTEGWMATISDKPIPRYLTADELIRDGCLGPASGVLEEVGARPGAPGYMTFYYIDEFEDLHSDNFSLEISFRNTYTKGDGICRLSRILVDCSDGILAIPFSIPGCVGDLSLRLNDLQQKGTERDFSKFGCDFDNWQNLRMEVKNRHVELFLNGQMIHQASYATSAGKIAGLKISFLGSGAIDKVTLRNGEGRMVFEDDFEEILAAE